ncbi:nitrite/sulfite reductase [Deinococcus yavapaiensis]|uniref:Sulfite reductase (Ferredoxin) n=1 Tax=Deinococcus yavapaiensis KR-236 TaxID=694435 RepID=A0A318SC57_9DEIO|nr:nitrite/sulfite reductase [Deinococcus yavapaiensis]PYE56598.1 sulfite reductase (ferredoxin) [Deinococcus yavapaiensis KR-236]
MSNIEALKKETPPFEILDDIYRWAAAGEVDSEKLDLAKWYGVYPQRPAEDGYLMLRVKIPSGGYDARILRVLAGISEDFARGTLDVSDRQAFQFHWLRIQDVPEIFSRLEAVGLHSKGACGDTVRAVIASPLAGLDAREVIDVRGVSEQLHHHFSGNPEFGDLPRKFKVSVTGVPTLEGIHLVNDIGFLAHEVNGEVGFDVWVGGGLGAVAHLAERLGVFVKEDEVLEVARAITAAYRDHGYRQNRKKSRLKYLIVDMGVEQFREVVETQYLGRKMADGPSAPVARFGGNDVLGVHPQKDGRFYVVVATTVGRIDPSKARRLSDLAERYGDGELRNTPFQNILIPNVKGEDVDALSAELAELNLAPKVSIRGTTIACTGIQFCRLALTETKSRTAALVDYLELKFQDLDVPFTINITGCSNACTRYQVADLGFMGAQHSGEEVYNVHLAGSLGEAQRVGIKLKGRVKATELHLYTERVLADFRAHRLLDESFVQFVDRVGSERFLPDVVLGAVLA